MRAHDCTRARGDKDAPGHGIIRGQSCPTEAVSHVTF